MFSPEPGHQGRGRPAPPGLARPSYYTGLSHCPALRASRTLIVSWEWNCVMRTDRWHQCIIINEEGLFVYCDGPLSQSTINRSLWDKVWWELLKSPSVNPWDVFLVVISLRISSIYYCFSIEHSNCHSVDDDTGFSRSGWHYSRITQFSDSSPGNSSRAVITL